MTLLRPSHAIDHIGLGVADLEDGVAQVAKRTGVTAGIGGVHPGRGTRNALMSLGGLVYLEIIAPVRDATLSKDDKELLTLKTPTPVFFAVRSSDLEATARLLKEAGFETSMPQPGSRKRPDGTVLKWRTMELKGEGFEAAPFFIQWHESSAHPSTTSPEGCSLARLEVSSRAPERLKTLFATLGLAIPVSDATAPGYRVVLSCGSKGEVVFSK